ncbi:extracellular solute-binding protein [Actinoallomurus purpureus]|uniref:extracellular solute-binding protein n=1 Tax=Actinoallomurus purpureus TaxID=478114 RepID=UPI002093A27A|nr:extracellular solute-binding protein [Actinoallomurus purpureus]MCO6007756.1 extracellular solute-binding protein [Actinoallomurus purpureus]
MLGRYFRRYWIPMLAGVGFGIAAVLVPLALGGDSTGRTPCPGHVGLVVAGGTDVSAGAERQALVRKWNTLHQDDPDLQARIVEISSLADLQRTQLAAASEARSCDYDVLTLDAPWTAEFAEKKAIVPFPLPHGWDPDFLPELRQSVTWHRTVYALPFNADVGLLYYWNDARRQPPVGLPDLLGQAAEAANGHGFPAGYSVQLADYEGGTVNALELIWGFGGDVVHDDQIVIDRYATQVRSALAAVHTNLPPQGAGVDRTVGDATEASSIQAFEGRQVAFMRNWPYAFRVLAADPRMRAGGRLRFGVSPLPGPSVLGGQNLAISAHSRKQEQARRLIEFLTDHDAQSELFVCGGFAPTRESAYQAPRPCLGSSPSEQSIGQADLTQLAAQIRQAIATARPRPVAPAYQEFSEVFRRCFRAAALQSADVDYAAFARLLRSAYSGKPLRTDPPRPCG